jgi:hypothetical protein
MQLTHPHNTEQHVSAICFLAGIHRLWVINIRRSDPAKALLASKLYSSVINITFDPTILHLLHLGLPVVMMRRTFNVPGNCKASLKVT